MINANDFFFKLYVHENKPWLQYIKGKPNTDLLVFNYMSNFGPMRGQRYLVPVYSTPEDKQWTDINIMSKPFKTPYGTQLKENDK